MKRNKKLDEALKKIDELPNNHFGDVDIDYNDLPKIPQNVDFRIFNTTTTQKIKLYEIATYMAKSGVDYKFIVNAVHLGEIYEGIYDLMDLWLSEESKEERSNILTDLNEEIEEAIVNKIIIRE